MSFISEAHIEVKYILRLRLLKISKLSLFKVLSLFYGIPFVFVKPYFVTNTVASFYQKLHDNEYQRYTWHHRFRR